MSRPDRPGRPGRADREPGLVLALLLGGVARNWRKPWSRSAEVADLSLYADLTRKAEAAKIHTIFLADTVPSGGTPEPSFEPVTLLSALAPLTERIGLIASISTTFTEPYNLARQVASLDRLSAGRAGWNLVTSAWGGEHFGKELPAHDERYAIADEFAGVVKRLVDSGELKTVRDVIIYHASAAGHWFPIGAVEQVADKIQERYVGGAADGFCLLPFFLNYPSGLAALTEGLIPELQRRGLFHTDYEHETLRANLGLAPYAPTATSNGTSNGTSNSKEKS